MNLKIIGDSIRVARIAKGLNQENVATELGISITAYSKIERGETNPSILRLTQIADCLGVKITSLLPPSIGEENQDIEKKQNDDIARLQVENGFLRKEIVHLTAMVAAKDEIIRLLKRE